MTLKWLIFYICLHCPSQVCILVMFQLMSYFSRFFPTCKDEVTSSFLKISEENVLMPKRSSLRQAILTLVALFVKEHSWLCFKHVSKILQMNLITHLQKHISYQHHSHTRSHLPWAWVLRCLTENPTEQCQGLVSWGEGTTWFSQSSSFSRWDARGNPTDSFHVLGIQDWAQESPHPPCVTVRDSNLQRAQVSQKS